MLVGILLILKYYVLQENQTILGGDLADILTKTKSLQMTCHLRAELVVRKVHCDRLLSSYIYNYSFSRKQVFVMID